MKLEVLNFRRCEQKFNTKTQYPAILGCGWFEEKDVTVVTLNIAVENFWKTTHTLVMGREGRGRNGEFPKDELHGVQY